MTPKTDVSMGLYARQTTVFVPSSPNLHYAEQGLCHRRKNNNHPTDEKLHHGILLPLLASPTAYCRKNTLLNSHERVEVEVVVDTLDVLTDDEKHADEATTTSLPIETNSSTYTDIGIPLRSIILLNVVAIIWGTQHSVIKTVVDDSVISGNGLGFTSWAEHVFGARWEQLLSTLQSSTTSTSDTGGNSAGAAAYFTLARFSLAALLAARYTPGLKQQTIEDDEDDNNALVQSQSTMLEETASQTKDINLAWKYGAELGIYMFLGYGFQAIGLQTTTASRSGFLLYLNVKLVPFFSFLLFGKAIQRSTWISALVAFAGTALLALDNASDGTTGLDASFTVGDLWSIAAAAASALFILRMEAASKAVQKTSELNAANLWTVAFLSLVWTVWVSFNSLADEATSMTQTLPDTLAQTLQYTLQQTVNTITANPLQLIYLSAVTTALANYLQSIAQKEISAERASVFYALDPVYGAAFANILLGETLGSWGWVGASLIAVAAATNAVWDFSTANVRSGSNTNTNKNA
eukprot:scaffold7260_cov97-Skeletonema_dohrnii-CCMP3373.AAC.4